MALFNRKPQNNDALGEARPLDESTAAKGVYSIWNHRTNHRRTTLIIAGVIVLAYIFFFLTPIIFHTRDDEDLQLTPVGESVQFDEDKTVTVDTWEWSSSQNTMIVKLVFDNQTFDGKNDYQFNVRTKKGKSSTKITPIVTDKDLIVLSLYDIPDEWVNMALNIAYADSKDVLATLFTTEGAVTRVDSITPKTSNEYRADLYEEKKQPFRDIIKEAQGKLEEIDATLVSYDTQKKEIRKAMSQSLPEDELNNLKTKLTQLDAQVDALNEQKAENQQIIAEAQKSIDELQATQDYYLGKQDKAVSVRTTKPDSDNQVVLKSTTRPASRVVGEEETTTHKDGDIVVIDDDTTKKGNS